VFLKVPTTGAGVGYCGSRVHAPNENIRLGDFELGAKHVALTLVELSTLEHLPLASLGGLREV